MGAVWSWTLRSRPSLRPFTPWTQTKPRPQSWSSMLRLWCRTLRPAHRRICPPGREQTTVCNCLSVITVSFITYVLLPPVTDCSATWTRRLSSPDPPTRLSCPCWITTKEWRVRLKTSVQSSWLSRRISSGRPCPTPSWAESCLPSC